MNFLRSCFEPDTTAGFTFQQPEQRVSASTLPPNSRLEPHARSHIPFSKHPRSLPNKLKQRAKKNRQGPEGQAAEYDTYRDFLEKKQSQMDMWGETFRDHYH